MPRSKRNLINTSRQAFSKSLKKSARDIKTKIKSNQKATNKDLALKARALKKLGLYTPKGSIAANKLTRYQKNKIRNTFNSLQKHARFKPTAGNVVRPLVKKEKVNKQGKIYTTYELNPHFQLLHTKKKVKVHSGTIKSSKGYIIEKSNPNIKLSVNRKGEILESYVNKQGKRVHIRRKGYKNEHIIKLINDIEDETFKLKPNQVLIYKKWGSEVDTMIINPDSLDVFAELIRAYEKTMPVHVFEAWKNKSEILIKTEK